MPTLQITIDCVTPHSIGAELGLQPGDEIVAVNGRSDLEDLLDYHFEVSNAEQVELHVRRTTGEEEILEIEKDPDEDLGLTFRSPIFTPLKTCNNACPFCFIDQQPEGLRASLYVKDDDYRLSYFNNTYITLTNLTPHDVARIERLRPGPLYVSVHATDPAVRQVLLQNKKAGDILDKLRWLKSLEIPFHCQVVVCPGLNDGEILTQTLADLATLQPEALSVAVVPVGLTQYRGHLPDLTPVDTTTALDVIHRVETFNSQLDGQPQDFAHLSDEFYFKANLPLPQYEQYGDFPQLDDGVGTGRLLLERFQAIAPDLPTALRPGETRKVMLLSGRLGTMVLGPIAARLNEIEGLYVDVTAIQSAFWGSSIDVAGLVTGADILATLAGQDLAGYDCALVPSVMLKEDSEKFLDDRTVSEVSDALGGLPIRVVTDAYSADELVDAVLFLHSACHPERRSVREHRASDEGSRSE